MANHLKDETSPYLLQHAENPVDWYPWGEEGLTKARAEDKPILLSIGYSACHWCHVMAHESFEDPEIARLMNDNFVNIKVDREERPDLDSVYMEAVQAITGQGGWPLTVFLTPETKPFFGGTYFPPDDRYGRPGFPKILQMVADAYRNRRTQVDASVGQLMAALSGAPESARAAAGELTDGILDEALAKLKQFFDAEFGGFGEAPKFPQPMVIELLLRQWRRARDADALTMATLTLDKMAAGGIYDQLAGGFHRYATDRIWLVPHFEKMLYDNALLSRAYLRAFQATRNPAYRRVATETIDYVLADLTSPEGGFYSTRDADSEGVEGKYYVWTPDEISRVLGDDAAKQVRDYFGVTGKGNFEGQNILSVQGALTADVPESIRQAKAALLGARRQRTPPGRDEKVLTSWNGMMLASLAEAACVTGEPRYLEAALANGAFLLDSMADGPYLRHSWKNGQARVEGFLEDYALVADGLLSLHEASFSGKWLTRAIQLAETMVDLFWDKAAGSFYSVSRRHQALFIRPKSLYDNAVPSGASAAAMVLLKLARLTGRADFEALAAQAIRAVVEMIRRYPPGFANWLCAIDFHLSPPLEIAVLGRGQHPATKALTNVLHGTWLPNKVVGVMDPDDPEAAAGLPLFEGRQMLDNRTTVYVCANFTCQPPVTSAEELQAQLAVL